MTDNSEALLREVAKVAESLSDGVRTIVTVPTVGSWFDAQSWRWLRPNARAFAKAADLGLIETRPDGKHRLTAKAEAVRDYLRRTG